MNERVANPYAGAMTAVPFDLKSAMDGAAWRANLRWPVAYPSLRQKQLSTLSSILTLIAEIPDPQAHRVALLVQGALGSLIRTIGELALLAEGAGRENINFFGATAEFEYIRGNLAAAELNPIVPARKKDASINLAWARQLVRVASWTKSPLQIARAMIAPDHVAVSHNALMRDVASRSAEAVGFRHAEYILLSGRRLASPRNNKELVRDVVDRYERLLGRTYDVAPPTLERMVAIYRRTAPIIVERAARDLCGLSRLPDLPRSLWAGSAGPYAVRAIAIEIRRRGGTTTGFDHGGSLSMIDDPAQVALRELSVNDRYVLPTPGCVEAIAQTGALSANRPFGETQLVAEQGDPTFRVPAHRGGKSARSRPRIYYMASIFRGLRQHVPTYLPDPVYLDWQLRLVEALKPLKVDLISKPHPEGLLKGGRHPLEDAGPVEYRRFEEVRADADGFLYDLPQSTTFWEAVCTDRPITLIDFGVTRFNATVAPLIERRCRIVKVRWDARNLPSIDTDELADALLSTQAGDPSEFRELLIAGG